jgi:hypothetical protein
MYLYPKNKINRREGELPNVVESKTELQVDVPLTKEAKLKYSMDMVNAMNAITQIGEDIKDYKAEKVEEIEKQEAIISEARNRVSSKELNLSDEAKLASANEIVNAMNEIAELESDLHIYQTEKKHEIAKYEAIISIARIRISRGKDIKWADVTIKKDFDKKTKTYVRIDTGEIIKTVPMTDDELQLPMGE